MPRSERQVPSVYFGRPGSLVTLPWPRGEIDRTYERPTSDFITGSGQHQVSSLPVGSRLHVLSWNVLHADTYGLLEQYHLGQMGYGPWAFGDPALTNMLLPNQSGATSAFNDARQWKTDGIAYGTPLSNSDSEYIHRTGAPRSLRWSFTTAVGTDPKVFPTAPYRSWAGFPVVPGLSYTWSFWVRTAGFGAADLQAFARMDWNTALGGGVGAATGISTTFGFWTKLSVTGTAPNGAAFVQPSIEAVETAPLVSGVSIYVDEPLLEQDSVANTWAGGGGARPVEILSLTERGTFDARWRQGVTLTLRELTT